MHATGSKIPSSFDAAMTMTSMRTSGSLRLAPKTRPWGEARPSTSNAARTLNHQYADALRSEATPQPDLHGRTQSIAWLSRALHPKARSASSIAGTVASELDDARLVLVNGFQPILAKTLNEDTFEMEHRPGQEIMHELVEELDAGAAYLIGLHQGYGESLRGHTAAMIVDENFVRFMDPNLGEFFFALDDDDERRHFLAFLGQWFDAFAPIMDDDTVLFGEVRAA